MYRTAFACVALLGLFACGDRDEYWDKPIEVGSVQSFAIDSAMIVLDKADNRARVLTVQGATDAKQESVSIAHNVVSAVTSPKNDRLFVLSAGDVPKRKPSDQTPELLVVSRANGVVDARRISLSVPLSGLALDPEGRWAIVYAGSGKSFVENPNELVVVDLEAPAGTNPAVSRTIRSFGGRPKRITFTPKLNLPGGPRRLLVVETEIDVTLLDLDHVHDAVPRPEITLRLSNGQTTQVSLPAGIVVDEGDPARDDDTRIAVRTSNDANVVTITLARPEATAVVPPNEFVPVLNLTDVGGIATELAFVGTDGGRRLAALVPSRRSAVLIEPDTSLTTEVSLPEGYDRLSVVTDSIGGGAGDVALLYGTSSASVALWSLGRTSGQPYRSVEVLTTGIAVNEVISVPAPRAELRILQGRGGSGFVVLNLLTRTPSPLSTTSSPSFLLSPDAQRAWVYQSGGQNLALVTLSDLHPQPLAVERAIDGLAEIAGDDGRRHLVLFSKSTGGSYTVLDAEQPDVAFAYSRQGFLLEP